MKIHWKTKNNKIYILLIAVVCMVVLSAMQTFAMNRNDNSGYDKYTTTPAVEEDAQEYVRNYQLSRAKSIAKAGYNVEMMRHREVVIVIIPTAKLFAPSSTEITGKGARLLREIIPYMGEPGFYRIAIAGYADNTGSPSYCLKRSGEQAAAVAQWLGKETSGMEIMDFAMGSESPLLPNNTVANRAANRRIEILLIPGEGLLEQAQ